MANFAHVSTRNWRIGGPFLIREHRNNGAVLETSSFRSAGLSSVLQGDAMDCSAQIFPVVPFHPCGKCTLLRSPCRSGHRDKLSMNVEQKGLFLTAFP